MTTIRPFALLLGAAALAACAAGPHNVPDEGDRVAAGRDSLVTGSAIAATLPFPGSVYPAPPSHHAPAQAREAAGPHEAAGPADTSAAHGEAHPAAGDTAAQAAAGAAPQAQPTPARPVTPNPAAPVQPQTPPPAGDAHEDHTGHDGRR